eukprot:681157-Rhodomonas_salina.1
MRGTERAYGATSGVWKLYCSSTPRTYQVRLVPPIFLCWCYAMSGTELVLPILDYLSFQYISSLASKKSFPIAQTPLQTPLHVAEESLHIAQTPLHIPEQSLLTAQTPLHIAQTPPHVAE